MTLLTPLLLMDFDGVWNPLNKYVIWTGTGQPDDAELFYRTSPHWRLFSDPLDNELYFDPDLEETAKFENKKVLIQGSSELAQKVNHLIDSEKVNFCWLTTWKSRSDTVLNPFLDLHVRNGQWVPSTPESGERFFIDKFDRNQEGKWVALQAFYSKLPLASRPPLIWVEDVTTQGKDNIVDPFNNLVADVLGVPSLVVATNSETGISRAQWQTIENWVGSY